ncbi:MAG: hypothetical protein ACYCVL_15075 [Gemmatimonadaceae bacterium]
MSLPARLHRRHLTRALAAMACAGLLGACMSAPTGDAKPALALALRPVFTAAANAGVGLDHIHIVITRPPATDPLVDTTIALTPGQDSVSVKLSVRTLPTDDHLLADIDLLGGGTVYYHGTSDILVQAGAQSSAASAVTVAYVGPGVGATSIAIAQRKVSVLANATVTFAASVLDANGRAIQGVPIGWSVSDATLGAIGDSSGQFVGAGKRGTLTVFAATPTGLRDSVPLVLLPAPTHLTLVGGDGQSAPAGSALPQPVVLEVDAVDGPVSGVIVQFDAGTSGGHITPDSGVSDAAGRVSAHVVLGTTTGTQHFSASAAGLPAAAISATATAVPAAIAKVSGDAQADSVGRTLAPFVVKVTDAFRNAAPGATVAWSVISGTGQLSAATSTTDASGDASATYTLGSTARTDSVQAALPGTTAGVVFSASAFARGAAALKVITGDGQTGAVGSTLHVALRVRATDALGQPVAGAAIQFAATSAGGSVNPLTAVTDQGGEATTEMTLGTTPGPETFSATSGALSVFATENAVPGVATQLLQVSGNGQSDIACAVLKAPLTVRAADVFGNGAPGASVRWAQVGGPGSHNVSVLTTDSLGFSAVNYQLPNGAGVDTLTATLLVAHEQVVTFLETITTTVSNACAAPPDLAPTAAGDRAAAGSSGPAATGGVFARPARGMRLP